MMLGGMLNFKVDMQRAKQKMSVERVRRSRVENRAKSKRALASA